MVPERPRIALGRHLAVEQQDGSRRKGEGLGHVWSASTMADPRAASPRRRGHDSRGAGGVDPGEWLVADEDARRPNQRTASSSAGVPRPRARRPAHRGAREIETSPRLPAGRHRRVHDAMERGQVGANAETETGRSASAGRSRGRGARAARWPGRDVTPFELRRARRATGSSPTSARKRVDFPAPEGPTTASTSASARFES